MTIVFKWNTCDRQISWISLLFTRHSLAATYLPISAFWIISVITLKVWLIYCQDISSHSLFCCETIARGHAINIVRIETVAFNSWPLVVFTDPPGTWWGWCVCTRHRPCCILIYNPMLSNRSSTIMEEIQVKPVAADASVSLTPRHQHLQAWFIIFWEVLPENI